MCMRPRPTPPWPFRNASRHSLSPRSPGILIEGRRATPPPYPENASPPWPHSDGVRTRRMRAFALLRHDDGVWDNPQGAFAWTGTAVATWKTDGRMTRMTAVRDTPRNRLCHYRIRVPQNVGISTFSEWLGIIWLSLLFRWVSLRDRCYFNVSLACPLAQKCVMVGLDRHLCQVCVICR